MGRVVMGMTMSVDGFVNDRKGQVERLYPDLGELQKTEIMQEAIRSTGAVVMGKRAYSMADDPDWYVGNYEFQVPIFVITHHPPLRLPKQDDKLTFTFVTDGVESAIRQAKAAAGDKDVTVIGGASIVQQLLKAGLVDELQVGIMPILLGEGLRFFEDLGTNEIKLQKIHVIESGERTDIYFRVIK